MVPTVDRTTPRTLCSHQCKNNAESEIPMSTCAFLTKARNSGTLIGTVRLQYRGNTTVRFDLDL